MIAILCALGMFVTDLLKSRCRLQAAGVRSVRACPCSVAVCAHSNRSDGHAPPGAEVAAKLTLPLDHSMGAAAD